MRIQNSKLISENLRRRSVVMIMVLALSLVILTGCTPATTNSTNTQNNTSTDSSTDTTTEEFDVEVKFTNYEFDPEVITADPGQTIRIKVTNVSGTHDFVIDELDVDSGLLDGNDSTIVEFQIPEDAAGEEYTYYCSVSNHRALGMEGTLRVNAD